MGLSVYCVVYAYTSKMTGIPATVFYVAGVLGIVFFAYSAFDNFFQTIQPKNALIIGNDGFADFTVGGVGVGNKAGTMSSLSKQSVPRTADCSSLS